MLQVRVAPSCATFGRAACLAVALCCTAALCQQVGTTNMSPHQQRCVALDMEMLTVTQKGTYALLDDIQKRGAGTFLIELTDRVLPVATGGRVCYNSVAYRFVDGRLAEVKAKAGLTDADSAAIRSVCEKAVGGLARHAPGVPTTQPGTSYVLRRLDGADIVAWLEEKPSAGGISFTVKVTSPERASTRPSTMGAATSRAVPLTFGGVALPFGESVERAAEVLDLSTGRTLVRLEEPVVDLKGIGRCSFVSVNWFYRDGRVVAVDTLGFSPGTSEAQQQAIYEAAKALVTNPQEWEEPDERGFLADVPRPDGTKTTLGAYWTFYRTRKGEYLGSISITCDAGVALQQGRRIGKDTGLPGNLAR